MSLGIDLGIKGEKLTDKDILTGLPWLPCRNFPQMAFGLRAFWQHRAFLVTYSIHTPYKYFLAMAGLPHPVVIRYQVKSPTTLLYFLPYHITLKAISESLPVAIEKCWQQPSVLMP